MTIVPIDTEKVLEIDLLVAELKEQISSRALTLEGFVESINRINLACGGNAEFYVVNEEIKQRK